MTAPTLLPPDADTMTDAELAAELIRRSQLATRRIGTDRLIAALRASKRALDEGSKA